MLTDAMVWMTIAVTALFTIIGVARVLRASHGRKKYERRCSCGYLLEGLEVPRCPECGTLVGFAPGTRAEDLGLTEEEMREAARRKELRKKMSEDEER